jgi:hypothetical protein
MLQQLSSLPLRNPLRKANLKPRKKKNISIFQDAELVVLCNLPPAVCRHLANI